MKTYQELEKLGDSDKARGEFCREAVKIFKSSREYNEALAGEMYYNKHNETIEKYQKFLYTISGQRVADVFGADYRLKTTFFRRLVLQQVQYVLGNGMNLENPENKKKLGKDFDFQLQKVAKRGMAGGRSFGFWNLDHLEVFGFADTNAEPGFCPVYDEDTSELMAGVRFWFVNVNDKTRLKCTLYEPDGLTEFVENKDGEMVVETAKRKYAYKNSITRGGVIEESVGIDYGKLPIVQLFVNDSHESELVGIRESIDAYDFIKSNLANTIDDTNGFYWLVKNAGGMQDTDLARLVQRIKTTKAAVVDAEDGGDLTPVAYDIPFEARKYMLELLRADIYEDFQALDVKTLSAAQKTTQEIQASYQSQDNKCADFEYYIIDFCQKILALAGIDDNPTFVWNKVLNMNEQTNMVLSAANYLSDETIIKHLPFLTPEEADEEIKKRENEQLSQFGTIDEEEHEADEEDEE